MFVLKIKNQGRVRQIPCLCALVVAIILIWTQGVGAAQGVEQPQAQDSHFFAVAVQDDEYIPGQTYWGRNQYIEYIAGDLPIIISAPHGGYLEPEEIPDRTWGTTGHDTYSQEYTREVAHYITEMTGGYPHVIICHLKRIKLDANRDIEEAAQGNEWAEKAWYEYHSFIEDAKAVVTQSYGRGHYFDFHTNGHDEERWVEFGYVMTSFDLDRSDEALDTPTYKDKSSLRSLAYTPGIYFPEVVRGATSLGGLLQASGYKSVPSPAYPDPDGGAYFSGGYNTARHGSRSGGTIDGTQVETHWSFVKDAVRAIYSQTLSEAIIDFLETFYDFDLELHNVYLPFVMQND